MASIEKLLEESRRELLDLSTRNRLLAMPVESKSARVIHVRDEKSDVVFPLLVSDGKNMSFLPGIEKKPVPPNSADVNADGDFDAEETQLPQPDDEPDAATGEARRHVDTKLQTALTSESLQRRLLALYRDAQLMMEEQGVNILYLALGRLKWFEAGKADTPRYAPLILVPVQLQRRSARDRFILTWGEEEVQENLSLAEKLKSEFGIDLPKFPVEEDIVPSQYAAAVAKAVAGQERWEAEVDAMTLGFFSFAKFLMYRDLDPRNWPEPARLLDSPSLGGTGVLLGELERKRGHRPVRKLLKDAGAVVQAIKPVFMMSPLSVAQFLEPGAIEFDLLVIDEASQVQPVDALGAFTRSKQHVVVGDSKQLPPARFFSRLTSNDDGESDISEDEMPVAQAKDVESILGLCSARGLPQTMLRWHYRSRHHSLIAVSNREFYEDKLFIVPSPQLAVSGMGLCFQLVEGGIYDRGQSATTRVEARAVCRAIVDHARNNSNLSLGVAAFSMRQQQAILDELELLRRENAELESFYHSHPHEPFFVKNLENVQGDERDVIFISVGYGPDPSGYIAINFGPLSSEGGERRLNVLISRAKRRCVVFTSLRGDDIDLARVTGGGVRAFKTFLQFAETGLLALSERTNREEDSPFEEAVKREVESLGYEVHPQVGVAGFFVDLGVIDPAKPGRYLLGIECDGAAYHSSRSARDRDRLRQAVLEDHGWIIHRIWSTDWFQRPQEQLRKVAAALDQAKIAVAEAHPVQPVSAVAERAEITRDNDEDASDEALAVPYVEARFDVSRGIAPHEVPAKEMAEVLFRIVQIESPVHEDELTARVRDLWGLGRAGSRIQDSVARGIRVLIVSQRCQREDECLYLADAPVLVRNRENVNSTSLRKPEFLPPQEIRAAIEAVAVAHFGASENDIPVAVSRILGFKATSAALREKSGNKWNP